MDCTLGLGVGSGLGLGRTLRAAIDWRNLLRRVSDMLGSPAPRRFSAWPARLRARESGSGSGSRSGPQGD